MPLRTHRLNADAHAAFLAARHVDPVSGNPFKPGDLVVVCAACGTPMLGETWLLLGGAHCGQSDTAPALPAPGFPMPAVPSAPLGAGADPAPSPGAGRARPPVLLWAGGAAVLLAATYGWFTRDTPPPPDVPADPPVADSAAAPPLASVVRSTLGGDLLAHEDAVAEGDGRAAVLYRTDDDELRVAVLDEGRVAYRLAQPFSLDTRISALALTRVGGADAVTFEADDGRWSSSYVWLLDVDDLAFRTRDSRSGDVRFSATVLPGTALAEHLGYVPPPPPPTDASPEAVAAHALGSYPIQTATDGAGGRGRVVALYAGADHRRRLAFLDGGRVRRRLDQSFSAGTEFDALAFRFVGGRDVVAFVAHDDRWITTYVWDFGPDRLLWRAYDRRSGQSRYSSNVERGSEVASFLAYPQ